MVSKTIEQYLRTLTEQASRAVASRGSLTLELRTDGLTQDEVEAFL